ncbi:hypothetical protein ATCC90586_012105 [Pythium insidiosum]|nr:hypothetical protein ATCC90586_012105 [Pythium insidiosum]
MAKRTRWLSFWLCAAQLSTSIFSTRFSVSARPWSSRRRVASSWNAAQRSTEHSLSARRRRQGLQCTAQNASALANASPPRSTIAASEA